MSQVPEPQPSQPAAAAPSSQPNPLPHSTPPRYRKIRELGHNRAGGRVTYLAQDTATGEQVVIKQFQFAQTASNWSGFRAHEREIQALRSLNHPSIPRYLDSFETKNGFCLVQEYKDAPTLATRRSFPPEQIKQIALTILDILAYLQAQAPLIIHRDMKPENILVDDHLTVYLIDFGFVRIGDGTVAISSMAAGTFGFMAPEQLYNRKLSTATDLYGLGVTLACLLTGTASTEVDRILDEDHQLHLKQQLPQLSSTFADWLQRMVQPNPKDRFPSAQAAQATLEPLEVIGIQDVPLFHHTVELSATFSDQQCEQTLVLDQILPSPLPEGFWEVLPDQNEPGCPVTAHPWISVQPARITPGQTQCQLRIKTDRLLADRTYDRRLCLHTTTAPETRYILLLKIHTAAAPIQHDRWLYALLINLFFVSLGPTFIYSLATVFQSGAVFLILGIVYLSVLGGGVWLGRKQRKSTLSFIVAYGISSFILWLVLFGSFDSDSPFRFLQSFFSYDMRTGLSSIIMPNLLAIVLIGIGAELKQKNRTKKPQQLTKQFLDLQQASESFPVQYLPEIGLLTLTGLSIPFLALSFNMMTWSAKNQKGLGYWSRGDQNPMPTFLLASCALIVLLVLYSQLKKRQWLRYHKSLPHRIKS